MATCVERVAEKGIIRKSFLKASALASASLKMSASFYPISSDDLDITF